MLRYLIVLAGLVAGPAVAADYVVIAATGGMQTGGALTSGATLDVPEGGRATVLGRDGSVWHAAGPCACVLPEIGGGGADLSAVSDLVTIALRAPGQTRDPAAPKAVQPNLWAVVVDSSGNRCVLPDRAELWRKSANKDWVVDLASVAARARGVLWPAGQHKLDLPADFVADGILAMTVDGAPRRFEMHVMPGDVDPTQWGEVLIWMAGNECDRQSQYLIDGLHSGTLYSDAARIPWLSEL